MIQVGILGATGYTALELIKLLMRHDGAQIALLTSRQEGRPHVATVHPQLSGRLDLHLEDHLSASVVERCDCVFSCLPHAASASIVTRTLRTFSQPVKSTSTIYCHGQNVFTCSVGGSCRS